MAAVRRTSVRSRLTVVYAATVFVVSSVLVLATYLLVHHALTAEFRRANTFDLKGNRDLPPQKVVYFTDDGVPVTVADLSNQITEQQEVALQATTNSLLGISIAVAIAGGLLALAVCWLMSGRVIRPLQTISDTAESIAGSNLDRRIRMAGPPDELKRLADTFDAMLERLDRSFDGQRRFVGNASHELRTPLAVSRTLIQVAMERPGASPDLRELGTKLLGINSQQARLTDALLTLARSEQELTEREPVDLGAVTTSVLDSVRESAEFASLHVWSRVHSATVLGDRVLLTQLVDNLVRNAVAYNQPGGQVVVTVVQSGDLRVLMVENTGEVIASEVVAELFEPFRRSGRQVARPTVDGGQPGVGLGLSIVRSIADAHGGQVVATPRPDGGLVVEVRLPGEDSV